MALRNFGSDNSADVIVNSERPVILHNDSAGNGSGLGAFHTVNPEDESPNRTPQIVGGLAVALMLGAAGVYAYSVSGTAPKPVVAAAKPMTPPAQVAAVTPAPGQDMTQQDAMMAPDANTPASTAPEAVPAPVKSADATPAADMTPAADVPAKAVHHIRTAKVDTSTDNMASSLNADKSLTVVEKTPSQTASATPLPTPPSPSKSDMASNNIAVAPVSPVVEAPAPAAATPPINPAPETSTTTAQNTIAPQAAQSSTPQADNAAPAQDQQSGATPAPVAPAQSSGQVNGAPQ